MREHDNRGRGALVRKVAGEPGDLLGPEIAHAAGLEVNHIDEADEMDAALIERIPPRALGVFAVAIEIGLALPLVDDVMFAWDVINVELGLTYGLIGIVELLRLRQMRDVAGVDHEGGLGGKGGDLADRFV